MCVCVCIYTTENGGGGCQGPQRPKETSVGHPAGGRHEDEGEAVPAAMLMDKDGNKSKQVPTPLLPPSLDNRTVTDISLPLPTAQNVA